MQRHKGFLLLSELHWRLTDSGCAKTRTNKGVGSANTYFDQLKSICLKCDGGGSPPLQFNNNCALERTNTDKVHTLTLYNLICPYTQSCFHQEPKSGQVVDGLFARCVTRVDLNCWAGLMHVWQISNMQIGVNATISAVKVWKQLMLRTNTWKLYFSTISK